MKINENIKIVGQNVILIPYEAKHVEKYHKWMKSEELQKLTASEPLTLEQEYFMQESWRNDSDKCTFLIMSRQKYEYTKDEIQSLVGDTNLFILQDYHVGPIAEVEIMIADPADRGKGYGLEALTLMLLFGVEHIKIEHFMAKIGLDNMSSIKMFMNKMMFIEQSRSEIFQEVTLAKKVTRDWVQYLQTNGNLEIERYP